MNTKSIIKHRTSGPWKWEAFATNALDKPVTIMAAKSGEHVATCDSAVFGSGSKNEANAILVALAPELLHGCRRAFKALNEEIDAAKDGADTHPVIAEHKRVADALWGLIARAEGREL